MSDADKLLMGLARTYMHLEAKFGQPGQPTFMEFPNIQGTRMRQAIYRIASVPCAFGIINATAVADEFERKAKP